jgi:5-methyltetrahydropteroyltriglutamate--homocysteine methyltransferase
VSGDLHGIRTDVVGGLLRPIAWLQARARFDARELDSTALADIELACVRRLVALQESIGLDVVTDGEIGRLNFQDSFGLAVSGFDAAPETLQVHQRRAAGGGPLRRWDIPDLAQTATAVSHRRPTVARLTLTNNVALAEYKRTQVAAKKRSRLRSV